MTLLPQDKIIAAQVEEAIRNGAALPRWGWPTPPCYNGAIGDGRISGWQRVWLARKLGLLNQAAVCGVCRDAQPAHFHCEIYARPLTSQSVCRSCHFHIHRRFKKPAEWEARVGDLPVTAWVRALLTIELGRATMLQVADEEDVFAALTKISQKKDRPD